MTDRRRMPVDGFEMCDRAAGQGSLADAQWLPAVVPGGVHEALRAAGHIPDRESDVAWTARREWWFRTRVAGPERAPGDRVRLGFDALTTIADLWLGGLPLGRHENRFHPAVFDVTDRLPPGTSADLVVRFTPGLPAREAAAGPRRPMRPVAGLSGTGFSGGGDFTPPLSSPGIWRPAWLSVEHRAVLTGHHVGLTDLANDRSHGTVRMRADVDAFAATTAMVAFTLTTPGGRTVRRQALVADGVATVEFELHDPVLWWTSDLGEPALHEVRIELTADGIPVDVLEDRVGLRTVTLGRGPDQLEGGRLFCFRLNGIPLSAHDAVSVPPNPLAGSSDGTPVRDRVRRAREGNVPILRVRGGYVPDDFYTACDEQGVLVRQDFRFAGTDYPGDSDAFRTEVAAEVQAQVSRLRNRACLVLWCGNGEVEVSHQPTPGSHEGGDRGRSILSEVLPVAVAAHDGLVPYWPGNPSSADDTDSSVSEFGIRSTYDGGTFEQRLPGNTRHDTTFGQAR
ncbi:hypothetical protein GCM10022222_80590 [Amycolatopsis ultiminotia]|uniref:beta-mannosidase n=1 Tax=Amycolatopsis ultiminotia TaxID=543629 RepID=A0ABP6YHE1_9PSEU